MIDRLSPDKIQQHITRPVTIHFYETIGSTNTEATKLVSEGAGHGTLVIARRQTSGRGRLGRKFESPDDSGIYMSIILEAGSFNPMLITTAAAVVVCKAIEKICGQQPQIKWVNDIYLNDKKVCGILAEAVTDHKSGQLSHIILGTGINCNADAIPPELADIAGSIEGDYSINQLAAEVHNQMMLLTDTLSADASQQTFTSGPCPATQVNLIADYRQRSMVIGKSVSVYKGGYTPDKLGAPARVLDIDENGGLKVIYTSGERETLSTGEISIRL